MRRAGRGARGPEAAAWNWASLKSPSSTSKKACRPTFVVIESSAAEELPSACPQEACHVAWVSHGCVPGVGRNSGAGRVWRV